MSALPPAGATKPCESLEFPSFLYGAEDQWPVCKTWSETLKCPGRTLGDGGDAPYRGPGPTLYSAVCCQAPAARILPDGRGFYPMAWTPLKNSRKKSCPPALVDFRLCHSRPIVLEQGMLQLGLSPRWNLEAGPSHEG